MIVRIIHPDPVRYSQTGFGLSEFDPGEVYEVSDFVARGMFERGWAEPVNERDLPALEEAQRKREEQMAAQHPPEPPPQPPPRPMREPPPPDEQENGDEEDEEPEPEERAAVRTRRKAR